MSALVKVYTDSGHTSEVAHTTISSTTTNGALAAGATAVTVTAAPAAAQGYMDIVDGTNGNETIAYYGLSGNTVQVANTGGLAHLHPSGTTVNFWYYSLAVGDQTNGIANDGTNATPDANNTNTWYLYNAGDQTAQSVTVATASGAPSTTSGFSDTLISKTSATTGFAASVSFGNVAAAAAATEFWVAAEIPNGQSIAGNPQVCAINITYSSI